MHLYLPGLCTAIEPKVALDARCIYSAEDANLKHDFVFNGIMEHPHFC